jgi:F-type H+-transporting ATPase subunit gamma
MASLKVIRKRIASVKSTQQITKAMKMVAAAKLRRAQDAVSQARPYADKLGALLRNVAARVGTATHPLLAAREEERVVDLLVMTGDRGLCGGYNSNLIRKAEQFIKERAGHTVRLTIVGRKGYDYFRKRATPIAAHHVNLFGGPSHDLAADVGHRFARDFASAESDGVYLLYSQFRSALSQVPTVVRLLPVTPGAGTGEPGAEYLVEPDLRTVLERLLQDYIIALIDHAFLEAIASEHAARMTAMESATLNAADMIERLTLAMNRARQAAITKELMEIVGGAEALKG